MRSRWRIWEAVGAALVVAAMMGCGSGGGASSRPDIDAVPDAELNGAAAKALLYEFRAKVRKHGVNGAQSGLPDLLENFETYVNLPSDDHSQTYAQIMEKLKAMQTSLASSPSKESVVQAAEEIGKLADSLPGKADEDPNVE